MSPFVTLSCDNLSDNGGKLGRAVAAFARAAGDDILRQFSDEFKAQFRTEDAVARWGGDEFVAIVTGPPAEGAARIERVRHWALGAYKINVDDRTVSVKVDAAIGTVFWNGTESAEELFARADKEMYRVKESSRLPA